jgi:rare lipoprotein A
MKKQGISLLLILFFMAPLALAEPLPQEIIPFHLMKAPSSKIGKWKIPLKRKSQSRTGTASWYSHKDAGINRHTANGEVFDDRKMTCASWDYAFGTQLRVTNLSTGKSVVCRVNDRGPHKRLERLIDLSRSAFKKIGNTKRGLIRVSVKPI